MQHAKVTFKGQITIPKAVREALNIHEGDSVTLTVQQDYVILRPVKKKSLSDFYGAFPATPATRTYPGHQAVRKEVGHKIGERLRGKKKP